MVQAQTSLQKIKTETTSMVSLEQKELEENLKKVSWKYLQDQDFFLYDDAFFNKKSRKKEKQDVLKTGITIWKQKQ